MQLLAINNGAMISYPMTLSTQICCVCGTIFAMPKTLEDEARRRGDAVQFYCPLGHSQSFSKSRAEQELEKVNRELQRERAAREGAEAEARWSQEKAERTERQRRAVKGHLTKVRNRIGKGACPCCNKTFPDLAGHMESAHPHYKTLNNDKMI